MWQTVFSMTSLFELHDINVKTKKGRRFVIDIAERTKGTFDSSLTVTDNITSGSVSVCSGVLASGPSATDCFEAALQHVARYLEAVDADDQIASIHNPCNCPFVPRADQERIANSLGIAAPISVN